MITMIKVKKTNHYILFLMLLILESCSYSNNQIPSNTVPQKLDSKNQINLQPVEFINLQDWEKDDLTKVKPALLASCDKITSYQTTKSIGKNGVGGISSDWYGPCGALKNLAKNATSEQIKLVLYQWFKPYLVQDNHQNEGIFTGYYRPELKGSLHQTEKYKYPIYALPQELQNKSLAEGDHYLSRQDIEKGGLKNKGLELLWVDDAVDLHIMHIQGSGKIILEDGKVISLGFSGHNGWPFIGLGKILEQKGKAASGNMIDIRNWLKAHPKEAIELMEENPRFIFFKVLADDKVVGALGVPLTGGRSLAIDSNYIPLGVPVWLETNDYKGRSINRLMVAQDIGSAIKGVIRGDFFWGTGEEAFQQAARMKSLGKYYLLLPKNRTGSVAKNDKDSLGTYNDE